MTQPDSDRDSRISVIAELSVLYEIPSLSFSSSEEEFAQEVIEKATRLFGVRCLVIYAGAGPDRRLVTSWGVKDKDSIADLLKQKRPNQFHARFGRLGEGGEMFLEQAEPISERERRLYTVFARRVQNVLAAFRESRERQRAEMELRRHRENLEELVRERTAELNDINRQLRQEITERKLITDALRESEDKYRTLVEASTDAILVETVDGEIRDCNEAACRMMGYGKDELVGMSVADIVPPGVVETLPRFSERELDEIGMFIESSNRRKNGEVFPVEVSARLIRLGDEHLVVAFVRDISERRKAEEERMTMNKRIAEAEERELMERTNRLTSLGLLAAGVAHEVNNPLQGMLSHLDAVKQALPAEFPKMESIAMVERGVQSIASLVRRLLELSRDPKSGREVAVCGEALDFVVQLMENQFRRANIRIVRREAIPFRLAIAHRDLVQVFLNLFINAKDAMPGGGTLTIEAMEDEPWCSITLADTGQGIPKQIIGQIFSPFFTTKGPRGTGLGLSVIESLIRHCGGQIEVESTPGKGSRFYLKIPLAREGTL